MSKFKLDTDALRALDAQVLSEYDEQLARTLQREREQKRRDEEKAKKKKKGKRKRY